MALGEDSLDSAASPASRWRRLLTGGTYGNHELTAATAALLLVLLAAIGVTILAVGPLIDAHLFIGMLLLGPLALKLGSVGYRFTRYHAGNPSYRAKGPPELVMRLLAPFVVISTLAVFVSGVGLLVAGPSSRATWNPVHKISFLIWLAVWWGHVILHGPDLIALLTTRRRERERPWDDLGAGRGARAVALLAALVAGALIAVLTIPLFHAWSAWEHAH